MVPQEVSGNESPRRLGSENAACELGLDGAAIYKGSRHADRLVRNIISTSSHTQS